MATAFRLCLVMVAALCAVPAAADTTGWRVDLDRSTFAVLTHREGFASALAHDHLILARDPACRLAFDDQAPEESGFSLEQEVSGLDVDPPEDRARLAGRLKALGVLPRDLPPISESDRGDIRAAMLGEGQLFGERFGAIRGTLLRLAPRRDGDGDAPPGFDWQADFRIEIRGRAVETTAPVRAELSPGEIHAELLIDLAFRDFGIEPYSAMLGAIRNADRFHLYVELFAKPQPPDAG